MTDTQIIHDFAVKNMLVEKYLLGELKGADLEDFEQHMFECSICFDSVKAGQVFTQHIAAGVAPRKRGSMQWWQRIREFFTGTKPVIFMFFQLGRLPSPPPIDYRPEFEFWAKACLCLFIAAVTAVFAFVLLFRYSDRLRERCALCVEKHGTPLGDDSKGGA